MPWQQLVDIFQQQRDDIDAWRNADPQACPNDGTPLKVDIDNNLRCPFDGWTWDGTPEGKRGTA